MNIVFTGWANLKDGTFVYRDKLAVAVRAVGYTVQSSVTHSTDLLVAENKIYLNPAKWTTKMKSAAKKGTEVISYDTLLDRLLAIGVDPRTFADNVASIGADIVSVEGVEETVE